MSASGFFYERRNFSARNFHALLKRDKVSNRPGEGTWYINQSQTNTLRGERFGAATDRIAPGDYDGNGKTDIAVYRGGVWYVVKSQNNAFSGTAFGASDDKPVPAAY